MSACGVCVHLHAFKLELQASSWLAEILTPRLKAYPSLMCTMLLAEPHETLCRSQLQPAGTKHCCLGLRCRPFTSRLLPARQRLHRNEVGLRSPSAEEGDNKGGHKQNAQLDVQDPSETIVWGGQLPSGRRALTGGLSALAIVLISDLGGATRALLGLDGGKLAGKLHLDVLYPVKGFKRCLDAQNGFEFQYPASWLADQSMFRRNAEKREQLQGLDPPSAGQQRRIVTEPVAAYGPPGSSGELNVSVIVAPIGRGFQLSSLGPPKEAGERFLSTIAPRGTDLETNLIKASERTDESGQLYYNLEYTVKRPKFFRHNISSYAARNGSLYTLNAQSPEAEWESNRSTLQKTAASFQVTKSKSSPQRLSQ